MDMPHDLIGWLTVCTTTVTILAGLLKIWIVNPLSVQIKELNQNFGTLNSTLDKIRDDFKKLEDRVDAHDVELIRHDEKLKTLFHHTGEDK